MALGMETTAMYRRHEYKTFFKNKNAQQKFEVSVISFLIINMSFLFLINCSFKMHKNYFNSSKSRRNYIII